MYTAETSPQVEVVVGGMPALCANLSCGYDYESTDALVTGMTVSGLNVVITGENFPVSDVTVYLANILCEASETTET